MVSGLGDGQRDGDDTKNARFRALERDCRRSRWGKRCQYQQMITNINDTDGIR